MQRQDDAFASCEQALAIHREVGNHHGEAVVQDTLADPVPADATGRLAALQARRHGPGAPGNVTSDPAASS